MNDRRDFFAAMGAALLAAGGTPTAQAVVPDDVRDAGGAKTTEQPFGTHKIYYGGETDMLEVFEGGSLRLKPGMEPHAPHLHAEEEILLVTEGTGEISVEGKITQVGPGSMMFTAGDTLHGIKNTGSEPLLFYYFKWLQKS